MDTIILANFGRIENGKLLIFDKQLFLDNISRSEDCNVELILKLRNGTVTQQMRRYYFGVLLKELQKAFFASGYEYGLDEIDDTFRKKALYKETFSEELGRYVREPHSLKDVDTEVTIPMMVYYIEYIIRFAAQKLDWSIAFPHEILSANDLTDKQVNYLLKQK